VEPPGVARLRHVAANERARQNEHEAKALDALNKLRANLMGAMAADAGDGEPPGEPPRGG
jgi:hypothetical protein